MASLRTVAFIALAIVVVGVFGIEWLAGGGGR